MEQELAHTPYELQAFEWTRQGVPLELRRTLAELGASGVHRRASERSAVALLLMFLIAAALVIAKAVHS